MLSSKVQLSDFHINPTFPLPEQNHKIVGLVEMLLSKNVRNPILVYTGDIIDSKYIKGKIPENIDDDKKRLMWIEEANQAYSLAEKYFSYLEERLEIDNRHIVLCVGNHDINQYDVKTSNMYYSFDCPVKTSAKIITDLDSFTLIENFCNNKNYLFFKYENHIREIDDFHFVVLNTQWFPKNKLFHTRQSGLCINCYSLKKLLEANKESLLKTKEKKGKLYNILVAHNPDTDYCEYARYKFPENDYWAAYDQVVDFCGVKMFGDKHSDHISGYDYTVGAPLYRDRIVYGLHFYDGKSYRHDSLIYENNKWLIQADKQTVRDILSLSIESLKRRALSFIGLNDFLLDRIVDKIYMFKTYKTSDSWKTIEDLYFTIVSLQKAQTNSPGIRYEYKNGEGVFDAFTSILCNTKSSRCLTLRGNAGTGANCVTYRTVLRSKTDAERSERTGFINFHD